MKMKREVIIILLLGIIFCAFISLFIPQERENYKDMGLPDTNHTVNLPINTTYECENKCMPPARCSITGEQCSSDIDCCGCNPYIKEIERKVEGFTASMNDITSTTFENPPQYFKGIDMWSDSFNYGAELYNKQHNPLLQTARYGQNNILLNYPDRQTLSGDFTESGAYPYSLIRRIH